MAIEIKTQTLFPVRRDKQIPLIISGGGTSISGGGGGSYDSSTDLTSIESSIVRIDTSLNNSFNLESYIDGSVYFTIKLRDTFIPEASLNDSKFKWTSGLLEPSTSGGTGDVTKAYVDGSLALRDSSLNNTWNVVSYVNSSSFYDASLSLRLKDTSLNMAKFRWVSGLLEPSANGDVTKSYIDGSLAIRDSSLGNLSAWAVLHESSLGRLDASIKSAFIKNSAQDASLNNTYRLENYIDGSVYFTIKLKDTFVPEASLNDTKFKWTSGLLEPSVNSGSGDVTKVYVDGSLALRDASLNNTWGITSYVNSSSYYDSSLGSRQKVVYAALSTGTTAMAFGTNTTVKVTPNATASYTTTVPAAGTMCTLIILTSGTTSYTITFSTGFKSTGTLATGTTSSRVFVIHWISDGTNLYESGRTAAMTA